jgi:hypothetical protein
MAADPASLRLFVDESLMGVGKALAYARRDVVHTGHPLVPAARLGALDTEWMPAVAALDLAVISRDKRLRTRPAEAAVLRAYGLRVFHLAGKRDLSNWDYLVRLVRRWGDIERILRDRGPGPWFMAVQDRAVTERAVTA